MRDLELNFLNNALHARNVISNSLSTSASAAGNNENINDAIHTLHDMGGGRIVIPPGIYNIDAGVELLKGVSIEGVMPQLDFYQNCPDLNQNQAGGTRLVGGGPGSGALFIGQSAPNDTGDGVTIPTFPAANSDGLGMLSITNLGIKDFDYALHTGSKNSNGLSFCDIHNIHMQDIHEWAIRLTNSQHVSLDRLFGFNTKRGVWFEADNAYCSPGISYLARSFFYINSITSGTDYAQRYGVYASVDSDLVGGNPFQLDGIRVVNSQINMYSGDSPADSAHIVAKGIDSDRCVTSLQVRNTLTDGHSNHAFKLENCFNSNIEILHNPATIAGDSSIKLINARQCCVESRHPTTTIHADSSTTPFYVSGIIDRFSAGSRYASGVYTMVSSNKTILGGRSTNTGFQLDSNSDSIGVSTFDPANPSTPKSTWATLVTKQSFSALQSGTSSSISINRAGVWKGINSLDATWTLPASPINGMEYVFVKKSGAGTITIDAGASKTIGYSGQTYVIPATVGASVSIVWDAAENNWHIYGKN